MIPGRDVLFVLDWSTETFHLPCSLGAGETPQRLFNSSISYSQMFSHYQHLHPLAVLPGASHHSPGTFLPV
jgi:hypothetical protein